MKGRILFFMIGLLPFFPSILHAATVGDLRFFKLSDFVPVTVNFSTTIFTSYNLDFKSYIINWKSTNFETGVTYYNYEKSKHILYSCSVNESGKYYWQPFSIGHQSVVGISYSLSSHFSSLPAYDPDEVCGPPPETTCPDTDGDGLCDPCDQWPDDPNVGNEWYLKGYLKYNGKIVGTYGSPSKNKPNYDRLSIDDEFAEPDGFPGLGMFVGAGGGTSGGFYVNQDIFHKAGGETVFLSEPALMFKTSCAPVDDITQCNNAICQNDKPPEVDKDDYPLNNSEIPTDEQYIELDKPYYKPISKPSSNDPISLDPCPEHRALCTNTCGGTRRVSNFACAGTNANSHVICSCDSTGGYEFSPSFNDIGDTTFSSSTQTGSSTINKYGSGSGKDYDPNFIGSNSDDLNQDGDFTNDSYSYKEGQVDFAPVQAAYGRLTGKFPFNLANSFVDVFRPFANAKGSTPTFSYSIAGHVVLFDLSPFNDFARFIRSMFALGLTLSTILALLYIYVGIDFRRK